MRPLNSDGSVSTRECDCRLTSDSNVLDAAMVLDRAYFKDHPAKNAYTRMALPLELGCGCRSLHVVTVTQLAPGIRFRTPSGDCSWL